MRIGAFVTPSNRAISSAVRPYLVLQEYAVAWPTERQNSIQIICGSIDLRHFAVFLDEIAHELLHRDDRRKETTHTIRETEAEAVAFVVCSAIGLDANRLSSDFIQLCRAIKPRLPNRWLSLSKPLP